MAQRFGGKHSPDNSAFTGKNPQKRRTRANLLFLAGIPLLFTAFSGGPVKLALSLLAFSAITLAAWLTREGLEAEDAYNARTIARRPAAPRKMLGSVLIGVGVALASYDGYLFNAILYGLIASALHAFAFGPDPMRNKGIAGNRFQTDRVARAVDEAEKHLSAMSEAIKRAGDRVMTARVEKFQTTARQMFRTVENDPRELTAARRYLGVYLLGARDATVKFVDLYSKTRDAKAKEDYAALLDDLEANFTAKTERFLIGNRTDLEIEIDVLRDRLQREGITPN